MHIYILKNDSRYFGYNTIGGSDLREFPLAEVAATIEKAFGGAGNVFLDSTINPNTMCVVVPDNWDGLMPKAAEMYLDRIEIVPFVFFLHPGITKAQVQYTRAPADAAYQLEYQKIMNPNVARMSQDKISVIKASPQRIQDFLRQHGVQSMNSITLQAGTPTLEEQQQHPRPRSRRNSFTKSTSANRRSSLGPALPPRRRSSLSRARSATVDTTRGDTHLFQTPGNQKQSRKPSWTGRMESMTDTSYDDTFADLGLSQDDKLDYQKAWQEVRSRSMA